MLNESINQSGVSLSSLRMGKHQVFKHVDELSSHDGISKGVTASFAVGFEASQVCRYPGLRNINSGEKVTALGGRKGTHLLDVMNPFLSQLRVVAD